jgi:hypothetical protein
MTKRRIIGKVVLGFLVMYVVSQAELAAQPLECPDESSGALMEAGYPVYPDAAALSVTLSGHSFKVKCIALSLLNNFVPGSKGAALYSTDHGDFDVVFLPELQNFYNFQVIERQKKGTYIYTFRGTPRPATRMVGKKVYFFKQSNKLFIAWDKQTATSLTELLNSN